MTVMERKKLIEKTEVLCAELERDDRDLGEILFPMEEVSHDARLSVHDALSTDRDPV